MATKAGAILKRSYNDFEPFCKWKTEEGKDILEDHLYVFKKEQLRVQINNARVLTISGERPVDGTKWSRFRKETKVSKDCKTNQIRAKFSGGILYLTMPTRIPLFPSQVHPTLTQQNQENEKPKLDTSQDKVTKDSIANELCSKEKSSVSGLKLGKKIVVQLAVAVVVVVMVVANGSYVTYKSGQCFHVEN